VDEVVASGQPPVDLPAHIFYHADGYALVLADDAAVRLEVEEHVPALNPHVGAGYANDILDRGGLADVEVPRRVRDAYLTARGVGSGQVPAVHSGQPDLAGAGPVSLVTATGEGIPDLSPGPHAHSPAGQRDLLVVNDRRRARGHRGRRGHRRRRLPSQHGAAGPVVLDHMRQLMGEQAPVRAAGDRLSRAQHDVVPDRVGTGPPALRHGRGLIPAVHAHPAEVMPERRLHLGQHRRLQRAPAGSRDRHRARRRASPPALTRPERWPPRCRRGHRPVRERVRCALRRVTWPGHGQPVRPPGQRLLGGAGG